MNSDFVLTNDYQDTDLGRVAFSMVALGGFGLASGAAYMTVNNSRFLKSLTFDAELKSSWKYNTGSLIGTNNALTKSKLISYCLEATARLGNSRPAMGFDDSYLNRIMTAKRDLETKKLKNYEQTKQIIDSNLDNIIMNRASDGQKNIAKRSIKFSDFNNIGNILSDLYKDNFIPKVYKGEIRRLQSLYFNLNESKKLPELIDAFIARVNTALIDNGDPGTRDFFQSLSTVLDDFRLGRRGIESLDDFMSQIKSTSFIRNAFDMELLYTIDALDDVTRKLNDAYSQITDRSLLGRRISKFDSIQDFLDNANLHIIRKINNIEIKSNKTTKTADSELNEIIMGRLNKYKDRSRAIYKKMQTRFTEMKSLQLSSNVNFVDELTSMALGHPSRNITGISSTFGSPNMDSVFTEVDIYDSSSFDKFINDAKKHAYNVRKGSNGAGINNAYNIFRNIDIHKESGNNKLVKSISVMYNAVNGETMTGYFNRTIKNANYGLKPIIQEFEKLYGSDVKIGVMATDNKSSEIILRIKSSRNGVQPVDIRLPVMEIGDVFYKNNNAYLPNKLLSTSGGNSNIDVALNAYLKDIHNAVKSTSAIDVSLDLEDLNLKINRLKTSLDTKYNVSFGNEVIQNITNSTSSEVLKTIGILQHVSGRKNSSRTKASQNRALIILNANIDNALADPDISNPVRRSLMRQKERIKSKLMDMGDSLPQIVSLHSSLSKLNTHTFNDMTYGVKDLYNEFGGFINLSYDGISAEAIMKGKVSALSLTSAFLPIDPSRGTKSILNIRDTFDMMIYRLMNKETGFNFMDGNGNSFDLSRDKLVANGFLNWKEDSEIKTFYKNFKVKKKELTKSLLNNLDYTENDFDRLIQIILDNKEDVITKENALIGLESIRNSYKHKQVSFNTMIEELKKTYKNNRFINELEMNYGDGAGLVDKQLSDLNNLHKILTGKELEIYEFKKEHSKKRINFVTNDQREYATALGYYGGINKKTGKLMDASNLVGFRQLDIMMASLPGIDNGTTFITRKAADYLGGTIKNLETNTFSLEKLDTIIEKEITRNRPNVERVKTLSKFRKKLQEAIEAAKFGDQTKFDPDYFFDDIKEYDIINEVLNNGSLTRYTSVQKDYIKYGEARAAFTGMSIENGKIKLRYALKEKLGYGHKVGDINTDKYLINGVVSPDHMLRLQRTAVIYNLKEFTKTELNAEAKNVVERFKASGKSLISNGEWDKFVSSISGDRALSKVANHYGGGGYIAEMFSNPSRQANIANNANNVGKIHGFFQSLMDMSINGGVGSNAKLNETAYKKLYSEMLPSLFSDFMDKDKVLSLGLNPNKIKESFNINNGFKSDDINVHYNLANNTTLSNIMTNLNEISSDPIRLAKFKNKILSTIKNSVNNAKDDNGNAIIDNAGKSAFIREAWRKLDLMLMMSSKDSPVAVNNFYGGIFVKNEDRFELSRVTSIGGFSQHGGFAKGAKIDVHSALMLKLAGMPHIGTKLIENMKMGKEYAQSYLHLTLSMMGSDPKKYIGYSLPSTISDGLKKGQGVAEMHRDVLKFKQAYNDIDYNEIRNFGGDILDLDRLSDKDKTGFKQLLNKGNILKKTIKSNIFGDMSQELSQMVEADDNALVNVELSSYAKNLTPSQQARFYKAASSRLTVDQLVEFQKMMKQFKGVLYGSDYDHTHFTSKIDVLDGKEVYELQFKPMYESPENLENIKSGKPLANAFNEHTSSTDMKYLMQTGKQYKHGSAQVVTLNDFYKNALAFTRALNAGADKETLQILHNNAVEAAANITTSAIHKSTRPGTGATVSSIGTQYVSFDYNRMNIWSVLEGIGQDITGLSKNAIKELEYSKAVDVASKIVSGLSGDELKIVNNKLTKYLGINNKQIYAADLGDKVISKSNFTKALLSTGMDKSEAIQIANDKTKYWKHCNAMGMSTRFPVLSEGNIISNNFILVDHDILKKVGLSDLSKSAFKSGNKEDIFLVNMYDALTQGGDLDRDMFFATFSLDNKYGKDSDFYKDLTKSFSKQFSAKYTYSKNGKTISIDTDSKDKMKRGQFVYSEMGTDITNEYNIFISKGYTHEDAIDKAIEATNNPDIARVDINGNKKLLFSGKEKKLLEDKRIIDSTTGMADLYKYGKLSKRARSFVFESQIKLSDPFKSLFRPDEFLKEGITDQEVDALLLNRKNQLIYDIEQLKKKYTAIGMPTEEIDMHINSIKETYSKRGITDRILKNNGLEGLNESISNKIRAQMPDFLGSLIGVKQLTGQINNTTKYVVGSIAMTVFGKEAAADTLKIMDQLNYGGDLNQLNISGKHKIPSITTDVMNTFLKMLDVSSKPSDFAAGLRSFRNGAFKMEMNKAQFDSIIGDNNILISKAGNLSEKSMQHSKVVSAVAEKLLKGEEITNVEYTNYFRATINISKENSTIGHLLGMGTSQDIGDAEKALAASEKSITMSKKLEQYIVENRDAVRKLQRDYGYKSMREATRAGVIFEAGRNYSAYENINAIRNLMRPFGAVAETFADMFLDNHRNTLKENDMKSMFHTESVLESIDKRVGEKIKRTVERSRIKDHVDSSSFARLGGFGLAGIAAIGFIGAFGMAPTRRDWLGPIEGTGGEYNERQRRKDEDRENNKDVLERLKARHIRSNALYSSSRKEARIIAGGIGPHSPQGFGEKILSLSNTFEDEMYAPRFQG